MGMDRPTGLSAMMRNFVICLLLGTGGSYGLVPAGLLLTRRTGGILKATSMSSSSTSARAAAAAAAAAQDIADSECDEKEYPWRFSGRLWFRPALVRTIPVPDVAHVLSVFGWTIGGVVALEYDDSPVGPYREYVAMGALVVKRGAIGSWGQRLYVSCSEAERLCQELWGVPAEQADIDFYEQGPSLRVAVAPCTNDNSVQCPKIQVDGWSKTRITAPNVANAKRTGPLPVLWTPVIKALWAPFVPLPPPSDEAAKRKLLPLHRLHLSASSLRPCLCGQKPSGPLGIPFGIGLVADNVLIEISPQIGDL